VVISPHVYPPTITNAGVGYTGDSLNTRLTKAHGYLGKTGFCASGTCKTFPIAVGEFGTRLTDSRDLLMMPQVRSGRVPLRVVHLSLCVHEGWAICLAGQICTRRDRWPQRFGSNNR